MQYFKEHKRFVHINLLISGRLNEYLVSIDEQAEDIFFAGKEYAHRRGVTEPLKEGGRFLLAQKMNHTWVCVKEIVERE